MAEDLVRTGFNAGSGYGEVWIRDFNTFIQLSCKVMPEDSIKKRLRVFFQMQGDDGNIIDGYIPRKKADVGYDYIYSGNAPDFAGHKNTVETDQETSLIQAVYKYVKSTGDTKFLSEVIDGKTVQSRLSDALQFLMNKRYSKKYGLIYGATTADWGDVQPETPWGVVLDSSSHLAIDIYDNAMLAIALNNYIELFPGQNKWIKVREKIRKNIRKYLWDEKNQKFIPHVYLDGSPFPASFDENKIIYHGGTTVAIEAGLLGKKEIQNVNEQMLQDVKSSGAMSVGLTVYPPYPQGFFKNKGMYPYGYQNGGDWTWFGARTITALVRNGFIEEAYKEISPMIDRVIANHGFYEWYTVDGKPAGSGSFRGSAGVLYTAIQALKEISSSN
jgi:glycogen debranching enzyme